MQDVNTVTLVGRLTKPPERRGSVLAMRLAYTASRKVNEVWEDVPQYVDAVCFGRTADALEPLLDKGTQVVVNGRLAWREWEAGDGSKRQAHEIACDRVQLVGAKRDGATPSAPAPEAAGDTHDDIPF